MPLSNCIRTLKFQFFFSNVPNPGVIHYTGIHTKIIIGILFSGHDHLLFFFFVSMCFKFGISICIFSLAAFYKKKYKIYEYLV